MPARICNFLIPWHLKIKISCNFPVDCGNTYIVFPYIWAEFVVRKNFSRNAQTIDAFGTQHSGLKRNLRNFGAPKKLPKFRAV